MADVYYHTQSPVDVQDLLQRGELYGLVVTTDGDGYWIVPRAHNFGGLKDSYEVWTVYSEEGDIIGDIKEMVRKGNSTPHLLEGLRTITGKPRARFGSQMLRQALAQGFQTDNKLTFLAMDVAIHTFGPSRFGSQDRRDAATVIEMFGGEVPEEWDEDYCSHCERIVPEGGVFGHDESCENWICPRCDYEDQEHEVTCLEHPDYCATCGSAEHEITCSSHPDYCEECEGQHLPQHPICPKCEKLLGRVHEHSVCFFACPECGEPVTGMRRGVGEQVEMLHEVPDVLAEGEERLLETYGHKYRGRSVPTRTYSCFVGSPEARKLPGQESFFPTPEEKTEREAYSFARKSTAERRFALLELDPRHVEPLKIDRDLAYRLLKYEAEARRMHNISYHYKRPTRVENSVFELAQKILYNQPFNQDLVTMAEGELAGIEGVDPSLLRDLDRLKDMIETTADARFRLLELNPSR